MRTTLSITAGQRQQLELECPGLALETAFVGDGSPETLVMVFRVEPLPGIGKADMSVVKFSASEFSIVNAECLQLGTHRYYRGYEGAVVGIRDEMDGLYHEDISDELFNSSRLWKYRSAVSAQATMGAEDQWLFCASAVQTYAGNLALSRLGNRFGYDCGTQILDSSAFAQELGAAMTAHTTWDDVQLSARHKLPRLLASIGDIERTVFVHHGPVSYPKDAAEFVNSFPILRRPAVAPFQKRPEFQWQQEYRFTVSFLGEPQSKLLHLPITTELRALASLV